jgi:shikimate kinase
MKKLLYLMGLPGSGKTTLGKQLSSETGLPLIDLDTEIERAEGMPIPDIFAQKGESYFRELESRLLKEVSKTDVKSIVSLGGGAPCFFDNIDVIKETGVSVYIQVSGEELAKRLRNHGVSDRPLLSGKEKELGIEMEKKKEEREKYYLQAEVILSGDMLWVENLMGNRKIQEWMNG